MTEKLQLEKWKIFGYWAFWVGVAFFSIYPTSNWVASQRNVTYRLFLEAELSIPLVAEFFWLYMSMYVLFLLPPFFLNSDQLKRLGKQLVLATVISGIIFLILPTELGFDRAQPLDPYYSSLFLSLFRLDLPHNLVPSLHVVFSTIIVFSILETMQALISKLFFQGWLMLLCLSTLLVHQHHFLDVLTGVFIGVFIRKYYE